MITAIVLGTLSALVVVFTIYSTVETMNNAKMKAGRRKFWNV